MWKCKECGEKKIIMQASFYHLIIDKDGQTFFYHPAIDKDGNLKSVCPEDVRPTAFQCWDCSNQGDDIADIADWIEN